MDTDEGSHPPPYAKLDVSSLPPSASQHQQQPHPAITSSPHQFTIITPETAQKHLHNYLGLAIVATIFCNIIIGACAVVFSVLSIKSARAGDIEKARFYGSISLRVSIAAVVAGVITTLVLSYLVIF